MGRIIQHEIASSISPEADNHKLWYLAKNVPVRYLRQVNKSDVSKLFLSHVSKFCLSLLTFTKKWLVVKVIHHIVSAEVHRLARELLDPEPEKKGGKAVFLGWRLEREEDVFFFFLKKTSPHCARLWKPIRCASATCSEDFVQIGGFKVDGMKLNQKVIQKLQIYAMPRFGWFTGCQMLGLMALHFDVPQPVCSWGTKGGDIIFDLFSQGANAA